MKNRYPESRKRESMAIEQKREVYITIININKQNVCVFYKYTTCYSCE